MRNPPYSYQLAKFLMDFEKWYGRKVAMKRCRDWMQMQQSEFGRANIRAAARLAFGRS